MKKVMFSKMPSDFVYFKQYNITAKHMYENLLALHTVDQKNQDVVTKDVYIASESAGFQAANKSVKRSRAPAEVPQVEFIWPVEEEEFVIT